MDMLLRRPTVELVKAACDQFDRQNLVIEEALNLLFKQYPRNGRLPEVLLKVVSLNRLYSTQIFAVVDVAKHIHEHAEAIDLGLSSGSPEIVETIGMVTIASTGRERYNYSFATKYCSWHNPEAFPIWDSRVDKYLWHLQKQDQFAPSFTARSGPCYYASFVKIVSAFLSHYGLDGLTFKQLDKFLWSEVVAVS